MITGQMAVITIMTEINHQFFEALASVSVQTRRKQVEKLKIKKSKT
jgi:hypothetical protein